MKKGSSYYGIRLLGILIILLLALTACTPAAAPAPAPAPTPTPSPSTAYTVNVASKADIGNYLVDGKGMTLYYFTKNEPGKSNASPAIVMSWPIFYTANIVVPPSLNTADFATITGANNSMQTTYKGWPLYYFVKDLAAGDTLGQGVNNFWFVINPASFSPPAPAPAPAPAPLGNVEVAGYVGR